MNRHNLIAGFWKEAKAIANHFLHGQFNQSAFVKRRARMSGIYGRHTPHQGARECASRRQHLAAGRITNCRKPVTA